MGTKKEPDVSESSSKPTIHEAQLVSGPSGAVLRGAEINFQEAVARRKRGVEVLICGEETSANRKLAFQIESAVGRCKRQDPHGKAGPQALPHYQPDPRPPEGHTFYETERRKAKRKP